MIKGNISGEVVTKKSLLKRQFLSTFLWLELQEKKPSHFGDNQSPFSALFYFLTIEFVRPTVEQPLHAVRRRLERLLVLVLRVIAELGLHVLGAAGQAAGADLKLGA